MGLVEELRELGYSVTSASELPRLGVKYSAAVPVLAKWLPRADTPHDVEWIARPLAVPWARREGYDALVDEFPKVASRGESWRDAAWAIGNALEVVWRDDRFDELAEYVRSRSFGRSRQMIVLGMRKSKRLEAGEVLASLLGDDDVKGHAAQSLAKHPTEAARRTHGPSGQHLQLASEGGREGAEDSRRERRVRMTWRENRSKNVQEDLDALVSAALDFAQQQLDEDGEFLPYGLGIDDAAQRNIIFS